MWLLDHISIFLPCKKKTSQSITISWLCGVGLVCQSEVRAEMGSQALGFVLYSIVFLMLYLREFVAKEGKFRDSFHFKVEM